MNDGRLIVRASARRAEFDFVPILVLGLVLVSGGACGAPAPRDEPWHQESGFRWRLLSPARGQHAGFTALSDARTGLHHRNDVDDEHALANRNLLTGAGVALGDVDGDGLPDVFLASVEQPAALYHNDGDFHFSDVTAASGLATAGLASTGAVLADVDGDRALDLLVGTLGGPLALWLNDGRGHFHDATTTSGLTGGYAATTLTLADVDGNGTLDLYVATYKKRSALDSFPPQARSFDQVVKKVGATFEVLGAWKSEYRIDDRPDLGGIVRSQRAEPDLFFLNDGRGHFTRVPTSGPRFADEHGRPLAAEFDYFTLAARFYDVNGDGAPDLYVCNDFEDPDQFWINDGHGNFRLAPRLALRETSNTCMSVDFADVNRDGYTDFFTADMLSNTLAARQQQIPTHTPLPKRIGLDSSRAQWMRNSLQLARGDGTWAQIADFAGVAATDWTWGSAFLDVDLDGYEDLLAANGHRWDIRDADTFDRIRNSFPRVPWNREQGEFPRLAAHSVALRNAHDATFRDMSRAWGFGADAAISQGMALADLDGDGDLDVTVTRLDAPPVVYRNDASSGRVAVRLAGDAPNTAGTGAVVTVRAAGLPAQSREVTAGGYYLSGSDAELTFAAGANAVVSIDVRWRDGRTSAIGDARPGRLYEIANAPVHAPQRSAGDGATQASRGAGGDEGARHALVDTVPLFTSATSLLGGHSHTEQSYDDFARQPLLPGGLSQLGPGIAWIDLDNDGHEDLVVGTGRGGSLTVLRNRGGRFDPVPTSAGVAPLDLTAILPVPDGRGGWSLVAGQSNYEAGSPEAALATPSVLSWRWRGGVLAVDIAVAAAETASVGPMATADVNGDGRLDLFVGARVIPGAWPLSAPSHLYLRSADGRFVRDTLNAAALSALGLVSSAVFTDLDGDGVADLVAVGEWGPVRVLHNDHGRLRDVTASLGLAGRTSRWNGVAAGDFDGDGRMDLVVTSWGRNVPWVASDARPWALLVGAFADRGPGLLFVRRDSTTGREMPQESFSRLGVAFPAVRSRIATFADYAKATADEVLGGEATRVTRIGATTFEHTVLLNRGDHFELKVLPAEAQRAPAFGAVVADFDGDGREDLFLAQNYSATSIGTSSFNAGAGQLLLGDGSGGFRALSVRESGVSVLGDQRGAAAADFDGDGRVDLAVSQNGARTTLWRNTGGASGLRVRADAGPANPIGVGVQLRVMRGARGGPVRELHAGSGYWSMDGAATVMARAPDATALWVRWPGGRVETVPLARAQQELRLRAP